MAGLVAMLMPTAISCGNKKTEAEGKNMGIETIMNRKSVRSFTGEKLSEEQIETILKAAMAAPSAMNYQPWSFVVVTDENVIAENFAKGPRSEMFTKAGAIFVVCGDTTMTMPPREDPNGTPVTTESKFWHEDLGACTENLLLAVEALGLGGVWTGCWPAEERYLPLKEALGLPETVVPYAVVPVGVPAGDDQPKDKWNPSKVHRNHW